MVRKFNGTKTGTKFNYYKRNEILIKILYNTVFISISTAQWRSERVAGAHRAPPFGGVKIVKKDLMLCNFNVENILIII